MLLTAPLLAKSSFFGSLINKCRQVIKSSPKKTNSDNHNNETGNISITTKSASSATPTVNNDLPVAVANLSLSTTVAAKTLEERIGLPPRPKKPLTPYFRYMIDMRPKLAAEKPDTNVVDLVREISKRWSNIDVGLKDRLQAEYQRDKLQYLELRTKYDAKLTETQRAEIKKLKQDQLEAKERRMMRKRVKDLGRPKKPASGFLVFIAKERIDTPQTAKQTYREWHAKATAKWTKMTDAEKASFLQAARKELDKYKTELAMWEEKMIRQGNIDVVRHSNLIVPPEPKTKK